MSSVEKLADKFSKEGEKALAFFSQLPEDAWEIQLYTDGAQWCVREVLAHLVETEVSLLRLFENVRDGGDGIATQIDIDEYNANAVAELSDSSPQELQVEFKARWEVLVQFVAGLSKNELQHVGKHPFLGETTLEEMLRLFYLHLNLHIRDVRAFLKG